MLKHKAAKREASPMPSASSSEPIYVQPTEGRASFVVRAKPPIGYQLTIFALLIFLGYIVFTIASMVPSARQHFVDLFLSPNLNLFLSR